MIIENRLSENFDLRPCQFRGRRRCTRDLYLFSILNFPFTARTINLHVVDDVSDNAVEMLF